MRIGEAVTPSALHFPAAKFLHVSAYAFLTLYLSWLPLRRGRWLLLAFLSLHAAGTEFVQQFVPGRHGMVSDVSSIMPVCCWAWDSPGNAGCRVRTVLPRERRMRRRPSGRG